MAQVFLLRSKRFEKTDACKKLFIKRSAYDDKQNSQVLKINKFPNTVETPKLYIETITEIR